MCEREKERGREGERGGKRERVGERGGGERGKYLIGFKFRLLSLLLEVERSLELSFGLLLLLEPARLLHIIHWSEGGGRKERDGVCVCVHGERRRNVNTGIYIIIYTVEGTPEVNSPLKSQQ